MFFGDQSFCSPVLLRVLVHRVLALKQEQVRQVPALNEMPHKTVCFPSERNVWDIRTCILIAIFSAYMYVQVSLNCTPMARWWRVDVDSVGTCEAHYMHFPLGPSTPPPAPRPHFASFLRRRRFVHLLIWCDHSASVCRRLFLVCLLNTIIGTCQHGTSNCKSNALSI